MGFEDFKKQPDQKIEEVPSPLSPGEKYEGYSEAGMIEDQTAEEKAEKFIGGYIQKLSEVEKEYLNSPNEGVKKAGVLMLGQLKDEMDRVASAEMKSAQNYNSIHDTFIMKYSELKMKNEG